MKHVNLFNIAFKSLMLIAPLIGSLFLYLITLNLSIWIYDDSKIKQALQKSKKVALYGFVLCLIVSLVVFLFQLTLG